MSTPPPPEGRGMTERYNDFEIDELYDLSDEPVDPEEEARKGRTRKSGPRYKPPKFKVPKNKRPPRVPVSNPPSTFGPSTSTAPRASYDMAGPGAKQRLAAAHAQPPPPQHPPPPVPPLVPAPPPLVPAPPAPTSAPPPPPPRYTPPPLPPATASPPATAPPPPPRTSRPTPSDRSTPAANSTQKTGCRQVPSGFNAATKWDGSAVFAYDTDYLPPDPGNAISTGFVARDGLLGVFEYWRMPMPMDDSAFHLAFIRLPRRGREDSDEFRQAWKEDLDEEKLMSVKDQKALRRDRGESTEGVKFGYFSRPTVHDTERMRVHDLRDDFQETLKLLQLIFCKGKLEKESQEYQVLTRMEVPREIASTMWKAWGHMHWYGLDSWAEYEACHRVFQRAAGEIDAWLDCCASLLRPIVRKMANHPLFRRLSLGSSSRRGVILAGDDIDKYHALYRRLGVPTYINIPLDELENLRSFKFYAADPLRCDAELKFPMYIAPGKSMPPAWYVPVGARWQVFEPQARGYMPREDDNVTEEKDAEDGKRKASSSQTDMHNKRLKLAQEQKEERLDNEFRAKHKDVGTSRVRYEWYATHAPSFRRYMDYKAKDSLLWLAQPAPVFARIATTAMIEHAHLSVEDKEARAFMGSDLSREEMLVARGLKGKGKGKEDTEKKKPREHSLFTFVPPSELIAATTNEDRQARYIVNFVNLLPVLLLRPGLAPKDTTVQRFGSKSWRKFGNRVITEDEFWAAGGGKIGGIPPLLGKAFEEMRTSGTRPPWGKLPCGHAATVELVTGDKELLASLCFSFTQWRQLHWVCNLASDVNLEGAKIGEAKDDGGTHRTADFFGADRSSKNFVLRSARQIVMRDLEIDQYGWPQLWSPATREPSERHPWLKVLSQYLSKVKHREELDEYMLKHPRYKDGWREWATGSRLWEVEVEKLTPQEVDSLEEHLYMRYALTSLLCKQVPPEFQDLPPTAFPHKCRICRAEEEKKKKEDGMDIDGQTPALDWEEQLDLPDEDE